MRYFLIIPILFCFCFTHSQTDTVYYGKPKSEPAPVKKQRNDAWKKKMMYGGNFQAWFGNPTFIFLSPTLGYAPVKNVNVGIGGIYNYTSIEYGRYGKYQQSIFGGHTFARYIIAGTYFVQAQYDRLYQPDVFSIIPNQKIWIDYFMVGGGVRQPLGSKAALMMNIMYNLTPHPLSIYGSPVIVQVGLSSGF